MNTFSLQPIRILSGLIPLFLSMTTPVWAGEYFSEEVTSPSIEVIHGWRADLNGTEVIATNTSRGGISVPLEVKTQGCGGAELVLISGRVLPMGSMKDCTINLFPFLDKLINQEVATLRIMIGSVAQELPFTDNDRLILARVANQSRDSFLVFQQELARVLELFRQASSTAPFPSTATPFPFPTPPPPLPTATPSTVPTPGSNGAYTAAELIIVGEIREERVGAGSRLTVEATNPTPFAVINAQARFDFYQGEQIVDTRKVGFNPSDVAPGESATAQVIKTDATWDRVTVSFEWRK